MKLSCHCGSVEAEINSTVSDLAKIVKYPLNCFTPNPRLGKVCAAKILNYWGNCFTWQKKIVLKWKVLC